MSIAADIADMVDTVVTGLGAVAITITMRTSGDMNTATGLRDHTTQAVNLSAIREDALRESANETGGGRVEREERVYLINAADIPSSTWSTIIGRQNPAAGDLLTDGDWEGAIVAGELLAQGKAIRLRVRRGAGGGAV